MTHLEMEGQRSSGHAGQTPDRNISRRRPTTIHVDANTYCPHIAQPDSCAQFSAITCKRILRAVCCSRASALILHMPYLDCMLNGVGMLSSQRINLTTLSTSARQTTHAPTAVELPLLLPDVGVRVCCAYHLLLPLAMH
jgi:hypothetical protein